MLREVLVRDLMALVARYDYGSITSILRQQVLEGVSLACLNMINRIRGG